MTDRVGVRFQTAKILMGFYFGTYNQTATMLQHVRCQVTNRRQAAHVAAASVHFILALVVSIAGSFDEHVTLYHVVPNPNYPPEMDFVPSFAVADSTVNPVALCVIFGFITSACHALYAFHKGKMKYNKWVEYSFTSTIMLVAIAALDGVKQQSTLGLLGLVNVCIMLLGWITEWMIKLPNAQDVKSATRNLVLVAFILHCAVWAYIGGTFYRVIDEVPETPTWLGAVFWSQAIFFSVFGIVHLLFTLGYIRESATEWLYLILSFVSKIVLTLLIVGFLA